jgi:23S rRNA (adenine2030-N6)-methyltransferase
VNYRHAFHAGNHADVLKHIVLLACVEHLKNKPGGFAILDAFGGPGRYNLDSEEAQRSPEWRTGARLIWDWADGPPLVDAYRQALIAENAVENSDRNFTIYPGSPLLVRRALRPQDRLIACELHPEDVKPLRRLFRGDTQTQIHYRDGWEAMTALSPFPERRGLILLDPPYEAPDEATKSAHVLQEAIQRFETAIYIWWRPLKSPRDIDAADSDLLQAIDRPVLRVDLAVAAQQAVGKLTASSLLIVNPPYGLDSALREAMPALTQRLTIGDGAEFLLRALKRS